MTNEEALIIARKYLNDLKADYVMPGTIGRNEGGRIEVIFLNPLALEPGVIIDPPDIKLWVDTSTGKVELIYLI